MIKVAIAAEGDQVSSHFGHCRGFMVYEVENGNIGAASLLESPGHAPGVLPKLLADHGVKAVIAGGMGQTAQELFAQAGVQVFTGCSGELKSAIESYAGGSLKSTGSVCSEHAHAGECGNH